MLGGHLAWHGFTRILDTIIDVVHLLKTSGAWSVAIALTNLQRKGHRSDVDALMLLCFPIYWCSSVVAMKPIISMSIGCLVWADRHNKTQIHVA